MIKIYFQKGFTIIELMVVMAITAVLLTTAVVVARNSDRNLILLNEQSQLVNALTEAKSLSIQTFSDSLSRACGYGVYFIGAPNNLTGEYGLFADLRPQTSIGCVEGGVYQGNGLYDSGEEVGEIITLNSKSIFETVDLESVLFVPPDPKVITVPPDMLESFIIIKLLDGSGRVGVRVNRAGQISKL